MVRLLKWWREILIGALIIAVLISFDTCSTNNDDIDLLTMARDSVRMYRTKHDQLAAQVETKEVTIAQLKDYSSQLGIDKQKLKDHVGQLSNLVGYWKGKAQASDTIIIVNRDTVYQEKGVEIFAKKFTWNNKYLFVNGLITDDKTTFSYNYTLGFELIPYRKRTGFLGLGKSQLVTDIVFSDPNIRTTEFSGVVIKEPRKKFYETRAFSAAVGFITGLFIKK